MILNADARHIPLADQSVHCVVTSPPYWGLRDYGADGQLGLERTPEEYVAAMVAVFREVRRVLRDDGTCWINLGDSYASGDRSTYRSGVSDNKGQQVQDDMARPKTPPGLKPKDLVGIPWRVAFALQADGWYLRSDIIWAKPNPMPESVTDRPTKAHEYLFLLAKRERYYYDAEAIKEQTSETSGGWQTRGRAGLNEHGNGQAAQGNGLGGVGYPERRNRRTVWEIATQPFSASALGCDTVYTASPDCPLHGLRAFPESWRRAADGEPQELAGGYRIDGNDARLAVAPLVVSASNSSHIPDGQPNGLPQTTGNRDECKTSDPSPSAESPAAVVVSSAHTTRTQSPHAMPPDNSDSLSLSDEVPANAHSMGTHKTDVSSAPRDSDGAGTLFRIENIARSDVRLGRDGSGSRASSETSARTSRKCSCKAIVSDHFATFPEALVEPCVLAGTSERGVCRACGAPWARVVERTPATVMSPASDYGHGAGRNDGGRSQLIGASATTTGWQPTCGCYSRLDLSPQMTWQVQTGLCQQPLVLDPFAGSGTVGQVCHRLGRRFVGLELKPDYCRMAYQRTAQLGLV